MMTTSPAGERYGVYSYDKITMLITMFIDTAAILRMEHGDLSRELMT